MLYHERESWAAGVIGPPVVSFTRPSMGPCRVWAGVRRGWASGTTPFRLVLGGVEVSGPLIEVSGGSVTINGDVVKVNTGLAMTMNTRAGELVAKIHYGPFEGRFRNVTPALSLALLTSFLLGVAVHASRIETLECVRPPGEVATCETRSVAPLLPALSERFDAGAVREARYRDVHATKGPDVVGGRTVLVDVHGHETGFGSTTVEQARLNTERIQRFLQGQDGSTLRIEVLPSYWKVAWLALWVVLALGLTITIVVHGCRDLGGYRIEVRDDPRERPGTSAAALAAGAYRVQAQDSPRERLRLRVTRTVLGIPLRVHDIAVPPDVTEVEIEQRPAPNWYIPSRQAPPRGRRLVLRTATGAALPVIPELRRGEMEHERARIALAKALGLSMS
ncbi:hypothetical protein [Sorangium sp. So ce204]|uniref:hypothetical protein n=1 Tax=Sorangium sp. So ce204 TaxID=3133288 RepID=UPI003F644373